MRLSQYCTPYFLVATVTAIVDIPAVNQIVESVLRNFSNYIIYNDPSGVAPESLAPTLVPDRTGVNAAISDPPYWVKDVKHHGLAAFNSNPSEYQVFRNVKEFGAVGTTTPAVPSYPPTH
jgi:glucan 1,3-beta-glucosidase